MITQARTDNTSATLQFASALSRNTDTEAAIRDLADSILAQIGQAPLDLGLVFFSAHHVEKAGLIAAMVREHLHIDVCLGCSGEGVIADGEVV